MASDSVSTACDGAPFYDIHTPSINSPNHLSDDDINVLNKCSYFAKTLESIVTDIRQNGYTERELPAFPKAELLTIMGKNARKKVLRGRELDSYLRTKLVMRVVGGDITPPPTAGNFTLGSLLPALTQGYDILKGVNARSLHSCLNYGLWLNIAYQTFEFSKGQGSVKGSWANWLTKNIGISTSYARQLRDLSTKFAHYQKMHNLSIAIKDLYKMRYEILHMLNTERDIANFWLGNSLA